ncbi:MAG: ATPase, partial [Erysipelotrichaceae bacterium]|nr:ATPase [Erysipelotrichaceae bacterium]
MSEIIASVYEAMEKSGLKEGILFLDEINCVSETLAPSMLQFLQYKVFGRHKVPNGWIVVTAGNPPEYNNSVREFDIVTWDRLKRIDVEPDYDVWKEYAFKVGTHPSITSYLEIKKGNFYSIETTVDGKSFVTARGWSDLSEMIKLYEQHGFKVNEDLIVQYLQNKKIAKDFAIYYDLFNKYKSDYQVDKILKGQVSDEIRRRAKQAKFDERLSLIGLLLDGVTQEIRDVINSESEIRGLLDALKIVKVESARPNADIYKLVEKQISLRETKLKAGQAAQTLSVYDQHTLKDVINDLNEELKLLKKENPENATAG